MVENGLDVALHDDMQCCLVNVFHVNMPVSTEKVDGHGLRD